MVLLMSVPLASASDCKGIGLTAYINENKDKTKTLTIKITDAKAAFAKVEYKWDAKAFATEKPAWGKNRDIIKTFADKNGINPRGLRFEKFLYNAWSLTNRILVGKQRNGEDSISFTTDRRAVVYLHK
jgi:hypothetical protein